MARSVLVDTSFLIAFLNDQESDHVWAVGRTPSFPPPWATCEAVLSEAFHLVGPRGAPALSGLIRRGAVVVAFGLSNDLESVLDLIEKYADVPMSFADACLVRMTEILPDPVILTTDSDLDRKSVV